MAIRNFPCRWYVSVLPAWTSQCLLKTWWIDLSGIFQPQQQNVHNSDVIMDTMASQITSLTIIYSTPYSRVDQRKHQSSVSLVFVKIWLESISMVIQRDLWFSSYIVWFHLMIPGRLMGYGKLPIIEGNGSRHSIWSGQYNEAPLCKDNFTMFLAVDQSVYAQMHANKGVQIIIEKIDWPIETWTPHVMAAKCHKGRRPNILPTDLPGLIQRKMYEWH